MADQTYNLDSRRRFLGGLGGLAVSVAAVMTARGAATRSESFDWAAPSFSRARIRLNSRAHRALGYNAAYCPQASVAESERVKAIERACGGERRDRGGRGLAQHAEADEGKRRENLNYVIERLALAEAVGARNCVDIAGSFNPASGTVPMRAIYRGVL